MTKIYLPVLLLTLLTLTACGSNSSGSAAADQSSGVETAAISGSNSAATPTPAPAASATPAPMASATPSPGAGPSSSTTLTLPPVVIGENTTPPITVVIPVPEAVIPTLPVIVPALPVVVVPSIPVVVPTATPIVKPASAKCEVKLNFTSTWETGYVVEVSIVNQGDDLKLWNANFKLPAQQTLVNLWNADLVSNSQNGYSLKNFNYNGYIAKGAAISFGMQVSRAQSDAILDAKTILLGGLNCEE